VGAFWHRLRGAGDVGGRGPGVVAALDPRLPSGTPPGVCVVKRSQRVSRTIFREWVASDGSPCLKSGAVRCFGCGVRRRVNEKRCQEPFVKKGS
jgi:hypothetical protein